MPIYNYECKKCNYTKEKITTNRSRTIPCPDCGGVADRIMSAGHVVVNGFNEKNGYSHYDANGRK